MNSSASEPGLSLLVGRILKIHSFRFSRTIERQWKIGLRIGYGNLGSINSENELLVFTPFFVKFTEKKNGNSGIWEPRVLLTCNNMKAQNVPHFSRIR